MGGAERKEEDRALKLSSPSAGEPIIYEWPLMKSESYDAAGEIIESIRFVSEEHKELNVVMEKVVKISRTDTRSYEAMKQLCEQFSRAADTIRQLWKHATRPDNPNQAHASPRLLKHVVQQCYNRSVLDPSKLNHYYNAFSPETYGETSFAMLEKVIEEIQPGKKDVFLDLGSGVGQVVLYMAGGTYCRKVIGIEKADLPANYAETMQQEFSRWMKWYGKTARNFELLKGNFLDERFRELILKEATIIFVNNFAFGPELNNKLKSIFHELRDGTRIISSIPFCNSNARMTDRVMSDLTAMMDVVEITAPTSSVSWTCKNVPYFIHTVNRTKLEAYFFAQKTGGLGKEDKRLSSKSSSKSSSRESSRSRDLGGSLSRKVSATRLEPVPSYSEHDPAQASSTAASNAALFGPTTRRQWNEWVSQTNTHTSHPTQPPRKRKPSVFAETPQLKLEVEQLPAKEHGEPSTSVLPTPVLPTVGSEETNSGSGSGDGDGGLKFKRTLKKKRKMSVGRTGRDGHRPGPGRPRKSDSVDRRHSSDDGLPRKVVKAKSNIGDAAIQLIHDQTVASTTQRRTPVEGSVEVADLLKHQPPVQLSTIPLPRDIPLPNLPLPSASNALDTLVAQYRAAMEAKLEHMKTAEFRQELLDEMKQEKMRNEELLNSKRRLEKQVGELLDEGSKRLKTRMSELHLVGSTPAELLEQSKEIVEEHQRLKTTHWNLEAEVGRLETQHRAFLTLRDPSLLKLLPASSHHQPHTPTSLPHTTSDSPKTTILRDIALQYRRQKSLITELSKMQADVLGLQANLPPQILQLVDSIYPPQPVPVPQPVPSSVPSTVSALSALQGTASQQHLAPTTVSTSMRGARRGRGGRGSTTPRKRQAPLGSTMSPRKDGEKKSPEEVERQIQDIVKKALSVDSAAKAAEKERRQARNVEKKARAKAAQTTTLPKTLPPQPMAFSMATSLPISATPTFSSPVYVGEAKTTGRSQSGSSAETESAPASDQDEPERGKGVVLPAHLLPAHSRPSSLPHPHALPHTLLPPHLREHRAASATPTPPSTNPIIPPAP